MRTITGAIAFVLAVVACCSAAPLVVAAAGGFSGAAVGGASGAVLAAGTLVFAIRRLKSTTRTAPRAAARRWRSHEHWRASRREGAGRKVEVLYFDGCPGHERALPRLRELAGRHGAEVELRRVETAEQAEADRFLGSPTIRVDGVDIEPGASERTDFGLKCRLYPGGQGAPATPPDAWITDALERAR